MNSHRRTLALIFQLGDILRIHNLIQTTFLQMSNQTDASVSSSTPSNHNFALLSICSKVTLDGTNYNDWLHNIKMALRFEDKEYVLEKPLDEIDEESATPEEIAAYKKH